MNKSAFKVKTPFVVVKQLLLLTLLVAGFTLHSAPAEATDPSGPVVVVFSNENNTDPAEEDADIAATLEEIASSVSIFDGGDGTAAAWTTALSNADVLVFPEGSNFNTAAIDNAAAAFIKGWIEAGKIVVGTGSYDHAAFINYMTGLDYSSEFANEDGVSGVWDLQLENTDLPLTVPDGNKTGGLLDFSLWSEAKKAFVTSVYYNEGEDNLGVGYFTFGSGYYIYNAYDWYPDEDDIANGTRDAWDATLQFAASGQISPPVGETTSPEPTLASTGVDSTSTTGLVFVSFMLVALGSALAGFRRIKVSK